MTKYHNKPQPEDDNAPAIIVDFDDPDGVVEWHSCGWGTNAILIHLAKDCISRANDPMEVIENLSKAGFRVILTTVAQGTA